MLSTSRGRALACAATTLALVGAVLPPVAAAAGQDGPSDRDGLSRFYRQQVRWSACPDPAIPADLQCGRVTVPVDYARPDGPTLDVALARYRATGPSRGSVVLNFGGPGGPGILQLAAAGDDFMGLTEGYDVVTFDPRGVGTTSPVTCGGSTARALEAADSGARAADPRAALEELRGAADACARRSGPLLSRIGTVDAARDLDVMRQALGDARLNYLGFSYGTRLGAVYAARFPRRVGRFALDGVDTLTDSLAEQGRAAAQGQQTALDDFLKWCTEDVACAFGQDTRTAREYVQELVRSLDDAPVPTGFGGDLSGQDLVGAIGQALYSKELWPSLSRALAALVEDGDPRAVMGFTAGGVGVPFVPPVRGGAAGAFVPAVRGGTDTPRVPPAGEPAAPSAGASLVPPAGAVPAAAGDAPADGGVVAQEDVPYDNLPAALMAVNCADDPDRPSADRIVRDLGRLRAEYEEASPVFGRYRLAQVLMCYGRPAGTDYIRERVRDVDSARMLLVGTRGDPATPYRWTVETAGRLGPSAVVLDNRGEGHTGYASSECVHRKVDDFLLYGSLPPDGSSCGPAE